MLYVRMKLTIAISLYYMNTLGILYFGIYNVVGDLAAMFGFLNIPIVISTQRFMSYSLGNEESL